MAKDQYLAIQLWPVCDVAFVGCRYSLGHHWMIADTLCDIGSKARLLCRVHV
jgi:hypothetical protein